MGLEPGETKRSWSYIKRVKTQHAKRCPEDGDGILQYIDSGQNLEIAARVRLAQIERTRKTKRSDPERQRIARLGGLARAAKHARLFAALLYTIAWSRATL